ncbi:MAG: glycosyltransferase [bacterium]
MTEPKIGIYGSEKLNGGVYNMLASFNKGLHDAFKAKFYDVEYMYKYHEDKILPDLSIAFNGSGADFWEFYLNKGIPHIMWAVDSIFMHIYAAKLSMKFPNFIFACVSTSDIKAINHFMPNLPFLYLPHAVDTDFWLPDNSEKEHDIVFLSTLQDFEEKINNFRQNWDKKRFDQFMTIYEYALQNPDKSFWDIYNYFAIIFNFDMLDLNAYYQMFNSLCYTVTYTRRVHLINKLKDFNVKVWGSPVWEKYISGNVQYMGAADIKDSLKIVPKSKIVLHLQPMQILDGLHERILNATSANSFILTDNNDVIKQSFGDTLGYYNGYTFDNLPETVNYYLNNNAIREEKSNQSRKITLQNHTWRNRVTEIFDIINAVNDINE